MKWINKITQNEHLRRFIETTQARVVASELGASSVVVAYYLLLSLFPLLIAVGNILPYLRIDPNEVLPYLQEALPQTIYDFLGPAMKDLLTQSSGSLLSISAVAALWSSSQSINALQIALNKAYGVDSRKNFIIVRLVSLVVIILLIVGISLMTLVLGVGQMILDYIQPIFNFSVQIIDTFQTLKWPITLVVIFAIMFLIYLITPNAKLKIKAIIPGTIFATVGWLLLSQVFGLYAQFFAHRVSGYQIIGSFIVLMIWLNLAANIIVLGGIINAVVQQYITGTEAENRSDGLKTFFNRLKKNKQHESK